MLPIRHQSNPAAAAEPDHDRIWLQNITSWQHSHNLYITWRSMSQTVPLSLGCDILVKEWELVPYRAGPQTHKGAARRYAPLLQLCHHPFPNLLSVCSLSLLQGPTQPHHHHMKCCVKHWQGRHLPLHPLFSLMDPNRGTQWIIWRPSCRTAHSATSQDIFLLPGHLVSLSAALRDLDFHLRSFYLLGIFGVWLQGSCKWSKKKSRLPYPWTRC